MEEDPGSEGLDGFEIVPPTSSVVFVREVETVSLDDTGEIYILERRVENGSTDIERGSAPPRLVSAELADATTKN